MNYFPKATSSPFAKMLINPQNDSSFVKHKLFNGSGIYNRWPLHWSHMSDMASQMPVNSSSLTLVWVIPRSHVNPLKRAIYYNVTMINFVVWFYQAPSQSWKHLIKWFLVLVAQSVWYAYPWNEKYIHFGIAHKANDTDEMPNFTHS